MILAVGAACSAGLWWAHPAHAHADGQAAITVADSSEAWYQTPPADPCSSPVGCPPVSPPSPYPSGTLNVAQVGASQTAAAYVQPDLSGVPAGMQPVSGTMTLPLSTVNGNGNANASAATVEACLATGIIPDGVEGSTDTPPPSKCDVKSPVTVGADAFTVDITPFLQAWNSGTPEYGIALLADTSQHGVWQVEFNGRNLAGAPHISSDLTIAPIMPSGGSIDLGGTTFGGPSSSGGGIGTSAPAGGPLPGPSAFFAPAALPAAQLSSPAPRLAPATPVQPRALTARPPARFSLAGASHGFQYPEVFLLPLALAAGVVFLLRLLTSDATPKRRPA